MFGDAFEKAGLNGLTAGAATLVLFSPKAKIYSEFAQSNVPLACLGFGAGVLGSLIGDLVHKFVNNDVEISEKWKHRTSLLSGIGINGVLYTAILCAYNKEVCKDYGFALAFLVGSGSEFIGSGSYSYLKENMLL